MEIRVYREVRVRIDVMVDEFEECRFSSGSEKYRGFGNDARYVGSSSNSCLVDVPLGAPLDAPLDAPVAFALFVLRSVKNRDCRTLECDEGLMALGISVCFCLCVNFCFLG